VASSLEKQTWTSLVWGKTTSLRAQDKVIKDLSTNMGNSSHSTHSRQGSVGNPFLADTASAGTYVSAGGSSGGSAVAVATGICHVFV